jgi:hypothetical protein
MKTLDVTVSTREPPPPEPDERPADQPARLALSCSDLPTQCVAFTESSADEASGPLSPLSS